MYFLRIPQIRDGKFSTELFQRYQRNEQALVLTLMEMVVNGVSTRKIARITEELCGTEFSASTVSNLCKRLDPIVKGWNERNLDGQAFPFVLVDAIVIKIREDGRVWPHSVLIAIGINELGHRFPRGCLAKVSDPLHKEHIRCLPEEVASSDKGSAMYSF